MRIWIVNHYALPPGSLGGPTRHLGISRALRDRGHEVTIVASIFDHYSRSDHRPRSGRSPVIEVEDGIRYVWVPTPRYGSVRRRAVNMAAFTWRAGLRARPAAPDVVIGSSPHLLAPLAAQQIARRAGVPFVLEVRDLWPSSLVDLGELSPAHPVVRMLGVIERHLYRTAAEIITVLPAASEHFLAHGATPDRLHVVPNGVAIAPLRTRSEETGSGGDLTVTYAGTMGVANGLDLVVDAASELHRRVRTDIQIRLVGSGPERERLAERARCLPNLSVEPPIPAEAVPDLLASSDVGLLVLKDSPVFRWGVSPTKLFDYLAAALPVITSVAAPDDIVSRIGAGYAASPGDPGALASALERMADQSPGARRAMGLAGRRYAETHHSFEALAEQMEAIVMAARERSVTR